MKGIAEYYEEIKRCDKELEEYSWIIPAYLNIIDTEIKNVKISDDKDWIYKNSLENFRKNIKNYSYIEIDMYVQVKAIGLVQSDVFSGIHAELRKAKKIEAKKIEAEGMYKKANEFNKSKLLNLNEKCLQDKLIYKKRQFKDDNRELFFKSLICKIDNTNSFYDLVKILLSTGMYRKNTYINRLFNNCVNFKFILDDLLKLSYNTSKSFFPVLIMDTNFRVYKCYFYKKNVQMEDFVFFFNPNDWEIKYSMTARVYFDFEILNKFKNYIVSEIENNVENLLIPIQKAS